MASQVYRIWIGAPDGSEREVISGSFSDDESRVLVNFDREVDRLAATVLLREGGQLSLYTDSHGEMAARLPPRPAVAEFLLQLRPFVLNDESTSFNRVANLLCRRMVSARFRDFVEELKAVFSGERFHDGIQVKAAGTDVNTEETVKKWLNAYEYHRDQEQQQALETLFPALSKESCEVVFLALLREKATAIIHIGDLIRCLIRSSKNISPMAGADGVAADEERGVPGRQGGHK